MMGIVSVSFKGSGLGYFTPVSFDCSNTKTLLYIYFCQANLNSSSSRATSMSLRCAQ
jgi:hypothetical protein